MLNVVALEQDIEARMQAAHVPGLALAIVKGQGVIYARGFGIISVEDGGLPVTPQTLFRIASVTKPLTGTAIMRLVEAGKLDLDRPIKEYIDWFTLSQEGAADIVTLRMLMCHITGLPSDYVSFGRRDPAGLEMHIREDIPHYPLVVPPGKLYFYSNPGLNVAGYIAEVVSGQPFAELMQSMVFDPLEMKRTTFDPTVAMTYPLALPHHLNADGTLSVQHRYADNAAYYPSGSAISTVLDLANFAMIHLNKGRFRGKQILSAESVAEMHRPHADLFVVTGEQYGLTFRTEPYKGLRLVRHNGHVNTFGSKFWMAPDEGVAVVMLFNRAADGLGADDIMRQILDQLLDLPTGAVKRQVIEPERELWPLYTGTYLGPYCGLATIRVMEDRLLLDLNGKILPLLALRRDLYFAEKSESKEFVSIGFFLEGGAVPCIIVDGFPCERFEPDLSFEPEPSIWQAYAGTYSGVGTYTVTVEDDSLYLHGENTGKKVLCTSLDTARFACEWGLFEFRMSDDGIPMLIYGKTWVHERIS